MSSLPFLAASPDAILECDCCGMFTVKIKYPMPSSGIPSYLVKIDGNWTLKAGHRHHTQMLGQMAITHIYRGYFFVFMREPVLALVEFDGNRWASVVKNLEDFCIKVMATAMLELKHNKSVTNELLNNNNYCSSCT